MGTIGAGFSMSLDGFIAEPNNDTTRLFAWMFAGEASPIHEISTGDTTFDFSEEAAEQLTSQAHGLGAILSGRGMFDTAHAWGGKHPMDVPVVVLTHAAPDEWPNDGKPFTFVTEGFEKAVETARAIAGEKTIGVGGADVTRQCLKAGLLDEIGIDLVPVLLGAGVRLFEHLGVEPIELEITDVSEGNGVTHLRYRVVK